MIKGTITLFNNAAFILIQPFAFESFQRSQQVAPFQRLII
jgi:hypothetical protein